MCLDAGGYNGLMICVLLLVDRGLPYISSAEELLINERGLRDSLGTVMVGCNVERTG